jgi:hypothetical protein
MQHMIVAQNPYSISKRIGKTSQDISDNKFMTYGTHKLKILMPQMQKSLCHEDDIKSSGLAMETSSNSLSSIERTKN